MADTKYVPINYIKYQRVTHEEMNYIQTQTKKAERIRKVDTLPSVSDSVSGDIVYLTTDNSFYGFDGAGWGSIGDVELPLPSTERLLEDPNTLSSARFDLSLLTPGSYRVYSLPDGGGVLALSNNVPIVSGDTEHAILYRGVTGTDIQSESDILISQGDADPYIEINKDPGHTGDVIKYSESLNSPKFKVENTGRTIAKRLTLFAGGDG